ncbi:MAG: type III-B CRISPR module RAMP protein Cmr6 [Chloroflexota bacterium]|nr:type III-B CRISPR module RAMP protein Cmr6 [Chloroflexota bacterium]
MAERTGVIKSFNLSNKYGEIEADGDKAIVKFHLNKVNEKEPLPQPGDKVTFEAPPTQFNKKKQPLPSEATSVTITERFSLRQATPAPSAKAIGTSKVPIAAATKSQPASRLRTAFGKYEYDVLKQAQEIAKNPSESANLGLLLDKYVGYIYAGPQKQIGKSWLSEAFVPHYSNSIGTSYYRAAFEGHQKRWRATLDGLQVSSKEMQTAWRLAIHLGRASVIENGTIALHPILGFPYIPGQSLKGLAHAYAELVVYRNDPAKVHCLFGQVLSDEVLKNCNAEEKKTYKNMQQGSVVFFDAFPLALPRLEVDILNPHFPDWYGSKPRAVPSDNQQPRPVNFLTVPAHTPFLFAVGPVSRLIGKQSEDTKLALDLLCQALAELGAGAKTAAGYGQFVEG